jgi:hypothetical protein
MQAKAIKPESKWQKMWRRANRRTPFWKQRLGERTEGELEPAGPLAHLARWLGDIWETLFALAVGAVAVSLLAGFVIGPIFLSPDFMTIGLADPIGRGLAAVCANTGQCDPAYLLAGSAVAVLILLLMVYVVLATMRDDLDEDNVSEGELLSGLSALDERLVHLRADLVLAGVLPLSAEEKADEN